jgi:hypothetical protein
MLKPDLTNVKSPVLKTIHPRSNTAFQRNPDDSDDEDESDLMPEPLNCRKDS